MIYFPTREAGIQPRDAGLPAGQVHTITVRADDGIELHGWHVLPDGQSAANREEADRELAKGRRLILYFSGNAANRRYRVSEFRMLAELGLDVFVFDYRGYGENSGSPSEAMLLADARAVWNYTTRQRHVRADRIILFGESLGGAVAVPLAADLCEAGSAPGGLILRAAFSSLIDIGAHHYPWLPVQLALVDRFPSCDRMPRVSSPLLQIHGARDSIAPIELGRRLFDAAPEHSASGIRKQFLVIPDAGHNDIMLVGQAEIRQAIQDFLNRLEANPN